MHRWCRRLPHSDRVTPFCVSHRIQHIYFMFHRLSVSVRIGEDDLAIDWTTIKAIFFVAHNLALWLVPLALAILLRLITYKYHHQLIFPLCKCYLPRVVLEGSGKELGPFLWFCL